MSSLPTVFVASSKEGLPIAKALARILKRTATLRIWENDVFRLSEHTMASLRRELETSDFAIIVMTADDQSIVRGHRKLRPRDNVVFEAGLFAGYLGLERVIFVQPASHSFALPSDLLGITTARYDASSAPTLTHSLMPTARLIAEKLTQDWDGGTASWQQMAHWTHRLASDLKRSPGMGGFMPDLILGISRGGIIVGDLVSRRLGSHIPALTLWADRRYTDPFGESANWPNASLSTTLSTVPFVANILVVDDMVRSGTTISQAVTYTRQVTPRSSIRSACLVLDDKALTKTDYHVVSRATDGYKMPFAVLD